jgi:hypothetical protein
MSDIVNDMKAYTLLNDGVIHIILGSNKKGLEKSKEILNRIFRRDLYRFVGEKRFPGGTFGEKVRVNTSNLYLINFLHVLWIIFRISGSLGGWVID